MLARLGRRVERALGHPQDIEWAIGRLASSASPDLFLLQTRPETVWSGRARDPIEYPEKQLMDQITTMIAPPGR